MEISGKLHENPRVYKGGVMVDVWMWCPWCGVTEWFKHQHDNVYLCTGSCKKELEVKL